MSIKTKYFDRYNNRFNYVFIDESGNSSNKMWHKVLEEIEQKGFSNREFTTFTMSGFFIDSKKKYLYLKNDIWKLKKDILRMNNNIHVHRTDLKSQKFLEKYDIGLHDASKYQSRISTLAIKHKLQIFSTSFNRELMIDKPKFNFEYYLNKHDVLEVCVSKLMYNIANFYNEIKKERMIRKKIMLVFEETNKKTEKQIVKIFSRVLEQRPFLKSIFSGIFFMAKTDSRNRPIAANEIIDFLNYPLFLWASNTVYHQTKLSFNGYPNYEKKSITLVDRIQSS